MKKHLLLKKKARLDRAKANLKESYFGIDPVIDDIIAAIESWYLFPDLQDRPVVVNLWGLTGVGKTSLILNLAKELDLSESVYHFDVGEVDRHENQVRNALHSLLEHGNGRPNLFILDEFQHARTLDEDQHERRHSDTRMIWQLLDSGTMRVRQSFWEIKAVSESVTKLRQLVNSGIRVEKGLVVEGKRFYAQKMDLALYETDEDLEVKEIPFISKGLMSDVHDIVKHRFPSEFDLSDTIHTMDGATIIDFLQSAMEEAMQPKTVDCTKSLIVVIGNLDEAYPMTHNLNPDLEADSFHELSKKITITQIKSALQTRFRSEQISRLGNTHVIYPAFNRKTFEGIIRKELADIRDKMWKTQRMRIRFEESISEVIYKEGVFPTQGARPVISTVHQMIRSKMSAIMIEAMLHGLRGCEVHLRYEGEMIYASFVSSNGMVVHTMSIHQPLSLEPLRKPTKDDKQAIVAVHEAGHAVAMIVLRKWLPDVVVSRSVESGSGGFMFAKEKLEYMSKANILSELATHLAGHAAEKLVFGEDHVTTGSAMDISNATEFIAKMLKVSGMGRIIAAYDSKSPMTRFRLHDETNAISAEAEEWLIRAMDLVEDTLKRQRRLLLAIASHLSDHTHIDKVALKELVAEHAVDFEISDLIEDGSLLYYRKKLKEEERAQSIRFQTLEAS